VGAGSLGPIFICLIYVVRYPFQNFRFSFSSKSLVNLVQIVTIQFKNLTKIIKIFIMVTKFFATIIN